MIRKTHISIALAGLALFAGMQAQACSTTAWGVGAPAGGAVVGTPLAGQPDGGASAVRRYSGVCGLEATASGNYVQDGSPTSEDTYIARFYLYTGLTSGLADVLELADTGAAGEILTVRYNQSGTLSFINQAGVANATTIPVVNNRWYHVHLSYTEADGSLDVSVQGAASVTPTTVNFPAGSFTSAGTGPDVARLGWVGGAGNGEVTVDAFESRRTTDIPRLCRGDATNDGIYNVADRIGMTNEILRMSGDLTRVLPSGQPDCTEDGILNVADRICVTNFIIAVPAVTCATS